VPYNCDGSWEEDPKALEGLLGELEDYAKKTESWDTRHALYYSIAAVKRWLM
jgi:hypothetical protein